MDGSSDPKPRLGRAAGWTVAGGVLAVAVAVLAVATLRGKAPVDRDPAGAVGSSTAGLRSTSVVVPPGAAASASVGPGVPVGPSTVGTTGAVPVDFCQGVDFAPVAALGAPATQAAVGDHEDKSDYTAYTCDRTFAKDGLRIAADVTALVGVDAPGASRRFLDAKAHAPSGAEPVAGVGSSAFGYQIGDGGVRTYQLWALDGRTQLGVRLRVTSTAPPGVGQLRDAAAQVARSTIATRR